MDFSTAKVYDTPMEKGSALFRAHNIALYMLQKYNYSTIQPLPAR